MLLFFCKTKVMQKAKTKLKKQFMLNMVRVFHLGISPLIYRIEYIILIVTTFFCFNFDLKIYFRYGSWLIFRVWQTEQSYNTVIFKIKHSDCLNSSRLL